MSRKWKKSRKPSPLAISASAHVPVKLEICGESSDFELLAAEGDGDKKLRKFSITAYTGTLMRLNGFSYPVVVELTGMHVPNEQMPVLLQHDPERIVGHSTQAEVTAQRLKLGGIVSGIGDDATKVSAMADNGFPWQASIGASADDVEFVDKGSKATVNGRSFQGPLYVARKTTLREVSFVSIGGDAGTSAKIAANNGTNRGETMNEFEKWVEAQGFDVATLTDKQKSSFEASFKAATAKPEPAGKKTEAIEDILRAARDKDKRKQDITEMIAQAIEKETISVDAAETIANQAIEGKWDLQRVDLEILRAGRPTAPLHVYTPKNPDMSSRVLEAAVCMTCELPEVEKNYDEQTLNAAQKLFRGAMTFGELIFQCAKRNGYRGSAVKSNLPVAYKMACRDDRDVQAQGPSTYDLPGIFSNVANKFLLSQFNAVESSYRDVASIRSVSDFKTTSSYSVHGDMVFDELPPGGEIKHGTIDELPYSNKVTTWAKMFGIDRRDIINDDLGVFKNLGRMLGRGGAIALNKEFWRVFLDNAAFFTALRGNFDDGSDSALDSDGLESANLLFLNQTDPDGNPLSVTPKILLVPNTLQVTAWRLINSQIAPGTTDAANPWSGMFKVVTSSYLSDSSLTGFSTTAWYLLGLPDDMSAIEIAFLNGQQTPTVERAEMDFDRLGASFRAWLDFGVSLQEYRAGVKMAGI